VLRHRPTWLAKLSTAVLVKLLSTISMATYGLNHRMRSAGLVSSCSLLILSRIAGARFCCSTTGSPGRAKGSARSTRPRSIQLVDPAWKVYPFAHGLLRRVTFTPPMALSKFETPAKSILA